MVSRLRSRSFYRVVLLLPLAMLAYLVASGRAAAYWRLFFPRGASWPPLAPEPGTFNSAFVTGLFWSVSLAPLAFAAWEIGREHTVARRRGYELLLGFREVVRRALGREPASTDSVEYQQPPKDNPRRALLFALGPIVLVPTFFATFAPPLRSAGGLLWLGGAGLIMGSLVYARYRAMAYLRDEPGRFDIFRHYRLMNTARYEEAGHAFVRWQLYGSILLMIWWLGVGSLVLFRA